MASTRASFERRSRACSASCLLLGGDDGADVRAGALLLRGGDHHPVDRVGVAAGSGRGVRVGGGARIGHPLRRAAGQGARDHEEEAEAHRRPRYQGYQLAVFCFGAPGAPLSASAGAAAGAEMDAGTGDGARGRVARRDRLGIFRARAHDDVEIEHVAKWHPLVLHAPLFELALLGARQREDDAPLFASTSARTSLTFPRCSRSSASAMRRMAESPRTLPRETLSSSRKFGWSMSGALLRW